MSCPKLADDLSALTLERQLDAGTEANYRRSIRFFSEFLGHEAARCDLTEQNVNRWLKHLETIKAPPTVLGHKRSITMLWNWLAGKGLVQFYNPRLLRKIKVQWKPPRAWSVPDVRILLQAAKELPGTLRCGITAKDLMTAWVAVAYQAGLRPTDIRTMPKESVDGGRLFLIQHKTKKPVVRSLSEDTAELLGKIQSDDRKAIFGLPKSTIRRYELKLFKIAEKYGFRRKPGQSIGTLRKTCATEIARLHGVDAAARSLGHVSGTKIALTHYIQPDALETPFSPPDVSNDFGSHTGTAANRQSPTG